MYLKKEETLVYLTQNKRIYFKLKEDILSDYYYRVINALKINIYLSSDIK